MSANDHAADQPEQSHSPVFGMEIGRVISYNFSEGERPGGMKVRAKIRIVTGRQAAVVNAAQAEAIRELLLWARQQRNRPQSPPQR